MNIKKEIMTYNDFKIVKKQLKSEIKFNKAQIEIHRIVLLQSSRVLKIIFGEDFPQKKDESDLEYLSRVIDELKIKGLPTKKTQQNFKIKTS